MPPLHWELVVSKTKLVPRETKQGLLQLGLLQGFGPQGYRREEFHVAHRRRVLMGQMGMLFSFLS